MTTNDPIKADARGKRIECARCAGHGLFTVWSFGVKEPDECSDCFGSGFNWQYPGGAIAKYYSGPLIGRAQSSEARGYTMTIDSPEERAAIAKERG